MQKLQWERELIRKASDSNPIFTMFHVTHLLFIFYFIQRFWVRFLIKVFFFENIFFKNNYLSNISSKNIVNNFLTLYVILKFFKNFIKWTFFLKKNTKSVFEKLCKNGILNHDQVVASREGAVEGREGKKITFCVGKEEWN